MDDFWYLLDLRWFSVIFISLQIVLTACIIYLVLVLQHERKMDTEILLDELRKIVQRLTADKFIGCEFSVDTEEVSRYEKYSFSNLGFEDETKLKSSFEDYDLEIDYSCLNENIHVDVSLPNIAKESSSKQPEEKKNELSPINKQDGFTPGKFQNDSWCSEGMENWKGFSFKLEKVQTLSDNVNSTADTLVDLNEPDYEKNRKVFSKPCQLYDGAEYDSFAEGSTEFESHCTFDSSMQNDVNDSRLISNKVNHDYADDKIEMTVNDIVSAFIETRKHADSEKDPFRNVDDTEYKTAHSSEKTISFKYEDDVKKMKRKRKKRSRLLRIRREKRRQKCLRDIITWQSTLRRNSFKMNFEIRPGTTSGRTAFQDIAQGDSNYDIKHNTVKENKKDKFVQQTDELDRNNEMSELPSIHNTQASNDSSLTSFETLRSFFNRASMPSKQKEDVFGYEWLRLGTFSDWPRTSIFCTILARNGWVSLLKGDKAQCFSCHAVHEGWKISDDPNNYHMQNCRFQSDQSNNVPIPRGTSIHTSNSKQTSKQYNQTVPLPENSAEENQALKQNAIHKPREFGIRDENNKMEGRRSKTNAQINDLRIGFIRTKTREENSKHATDASPKEEEEQEQEQEEPMVASPRQQLSAETSSSELVTTSIRRKTDTRRYSETPTPRVSLGDHHHTQTTGIPSPHRKGAQLERMSFDGPKFPSYAQLAERISSYTNWPPDMTQTPQELASAGFFYAGHDSYIRCFFCGGSLGKWEVRHDPWVEHASWFKHCPFVRQSRGQEFVDLVQKNADLRNREKIGNHQTNTLKGIASICEESEEEVHRHQQLLQNGKQLSQNNHIDVLKRQTIQEMQQTALVPMNCTLNSTCLHLEDMVDGDEGASEVRSLPSSRFTTPISTEDPENIFILSEENTEAFCYEVIRHNTFFKKPFTSKLSAILAKNGWVAFGKGDKTRCHSCHVVHEGWRPCDDPGRYHISGCSFRSCHTNNISLSYDYSRDIQTSRPLNDSPLSEEKYEMFQAAVLNSNQSDTSNPQLEPTKRDPMRLSLNFDCPKHPCYATLAKRISSYNDWPAAKTQTPQEMAEAGFFYEGNDDCTQCFSCGGGLRSWGAGEDPWFEHARWFKECAFLRQNRGQEFIDLVQNRVAELEKEERLVTTIKEMGYSETKIKSAIHIIKSRLPRGNRKVSAQDILEVIFESHSSTTVSENFMLDTDQLDCAVASRSYHMRQSEPPHFQHKAVCATDTLTIDQTSHEEEFSRHSIENSIFDDLNSLSQENMDLKKKFLCNICTDEMVSIVFLPCGHLACCEDCAPAMNKCPICRIFITETINAFLK